MSYEKQNFKDGLTLFASQLNYIEDGIVALEKSIPSLNESVDLVCVEPAEDDIPKVFFGGTLQQTKTEKVVPFRYISKTEDFSGYAEIKAQGNSSMNYPKKNQTVKMFKDADCTEKMKVDFKGWGKQNKHVYKANWIDLTHARNVVSARLWADVVKSRANYAELPELLRTSPNQGAVDGFPVKVYAAGVYQGRYSLNIPKDAWMANMDDELDEHCILCGENYVSGCFRAAANINESDWTDEIHDTVPASIKTRWNEVISFVMNSTDEDFKANLGNYFDIPSLIDYYLFGLASCGLDAFGKNQLYMTYDGQKWIATMYDMDSTWGLYYNGQKFVATDYGRNQYEDYVNSTGNLLYVRLEQLFRSGLYARWVELKNGALSIENIINRFERFTDIASAELVKEDYASTTGGGAFTGIPSKDTSNIQQIRSFALARQAWVDEYVAGLIPEVEVPCTGISLNTYTLTFTAEGSQTLIATVTPDNCDEIVTWKSDNTSIATVSGGVVTAVSNGNTTITAKCGEHSASCSVTVSSMAQAVVCTGVTINKTELTFNGEGTQTISAMVTPSNTTDPVVWVSSNPAVASITVVGNICSVQSVSNGSAKITITCGDQSATCAVTVSGIVDPSLLYSLEEATTFNGTSDYINTGVKLFDESKDFSIVLDFQANEGMAASATILNALLEASPYSGLCLRYRADSIEISSGTTGNKTLITGDSVTNRIKFAVNYNAADGTMVVWCGESSESPNIIVYTPNTTAHTKTVLLGCSETADGTKQRFWTGTIHSCEIYARELTGAEIKAKLDYADAEDIVWTSNSKVSNTNGGVDSGSNYVSSLIEIPEGVSAVELANTGTGAYTWLTIVEYDEYARFTKYNESKTSPLNCTLQTNTKYIRAGAYPATDACTDPANQLALIW